MKRRYWGVNLLFLAPVLITFLLVMVVPFFMGIYYSMTDFNGVRSELTFVGLNNYQAMFQDPVFLHSFLLTLQYTLINVVLVNLVAFGLALLVTGNLKGRNFLRAGFFVPNLIGGIVLGYIWQFIFNNILTQVGKSYELAWLAKSLIGNKDTVLWAMSGVNTWQYAGYIMMIFVAAIQGIPANLLEAASVDGANGWRKLRSITIPMLANAFTITTFLTLTNSFKLFDQNLSLTGGEPAKQTMMLAYNIYDTFYARSGPQWKGIGQAKAVVFCLFVVVLAVLQQKLTQSKEVQQ